MNGALRSFLGLVVVACSIAVEHSAWGGGQNATQASLQHTDHTATTHTGWVFINQVFIPPPYVVTSTPDAVSVNGELLVSADQLRDHIDRREFDRGRGRGRRSMRSGPEFGVRDIAYRERESPSLDETHRSINQMLAKGNVVIVDGDGGILDLYDAAEQKYFWSSVLGNAGEPSDAMAVRRELVSSQPWIRGLGENPALVQAGTAVLAGFDEIAIGNDLQSDAVRGLERWSYPLTVLGMLLGVLAIGHLLKSAANPSLAGAGNSDGPSDLVNPAIVKATAVSIGLIFAMSMLDLAWTLLASQAGQMRELNPIGARLIHSPGLLVAFKAIVTGGACLIFYWLRKHTQTQIAAWWMCLVLCLLTMRWLVFNSLFI